MHHQQARSVRALNMQCKPEYQKISLLLCNLLITWGTFEPEISECCSVAMNLVCNWTCDQVQYLEGNVMRFKQIDCTVAFDLGILWLSPQISIHCGIWCDGILTCGSDIVCSENQTNDIRGFWTFVGIWRWLLRSNCDSKFIRASALCGRRFSMLVSVSIS